MDDILFHFKNNIDTFIISILLVITYAKSQKPLHTITLCSPIKLIYAKINCIVNTS